MTTVLVDTSVWVDHFRRPNQALVDLLLQDAVRRAAGWWTWACWRRRC